MAGRFSRIVVPNARNSKMMKTRRKRPFRRSGGASGPQNIVVNGDLDARGSSIVDNGDFSDGANGWNAGTGWSIGNGLATCDGTVASNANLDCAIGNGEAEPDKFYEVTYDVVNHVNSRVRWQCGGTVGTFRDANGTYVESFQAPGSNRLRMTGNLNFEGSVDNILMQEVGGGWDWTGDGWFWEDGQAKCDGSQASTSSLNNSGSAEIGALYQVDYDIVELSAGRVRFRVGNPTPGWQSAAGPVSYQTRCEDTGDLFFQGDVNFVGAIDNVVVTKVDTPSTNTMNVGTSGTNVRGFLRSSYGTLTPNTFAGEEISQLTVQTQGGEDSKITFRMLGDPQPFPDIVIEWGGGFLSTGFTWTGVRYELTILGSRDLYNYLDGLVGSDLDIAIVGVS